MESPYSKLENKRKELLLARYQEDQRLDEAAKKRKEDLEGFGMSEKVTRELAAQKEIYTAETRENRMLATLKQNQDNERNFMRVRHLNEIDEAETRREAIIKSLKKKHEEEARQFQNDLKARESAVDLQWTFDKEQLRKQREMEDTNLGSDMVYEMDKKVKPEMSNSIPSKQHANPSKSVPVTPVKRPRADSSENTMTTPMRSKPSTPGSTSFSPPTGPRSPYPNQRPNQPSFATGANTVSPISGSPSQPSPSIKGHSSSSDSKIFRVRPPKSTRSTASSPTSIAKHAAFERERKSSVSTINENHAIVENARKASASTTDGGFELHYLDFVKPRGGHSIWKSSDHKGDETRLVWEDGVFRLRNKNGRAKGVDEFQIDPKPMESVKYCPGTFTVHMTRSKTAKVGNELHIMFKRKSVLLGFVEFYKSKWPHQVIREVKNLEVPASSISGNPEPWRIRG